METTDAEFEEDMNIKEEPSDDGYQIETTNTSASQEADLSHDYQEHSISSSNPHTGYDVQYSHNSTSDSEDSEEDEVVPRNIRNAFVSMERLNMELDENNSCIVTSNYSHHDNSEASGAENSGPSSSETEVGSRQIGNTNASQTYGSLIDMKPSIEVLNQECQDWEVQNSLSSENEDNNSQNKSSDHDYNDGQYIKEEKVDSGYDLAYENYTSSTKEETNDNCEVSVNFPTDSDDKSRRKQKFGKRPKKGKKRGRKSKKDFIETSMEEPEVYMDRGGDMIEGEKETSETPNSSSNMIAQFAIIDPKKSEMVGIKSVNPKQCNICNMEFSYEFHRKFHMQKEHPEHLEKDKRRTDPTYLQNELNNKGRYAKKCFICKDKLYTHPYFLSLHMQSNHRPWLVNNNWLKKLSDMIGNKEGESSVHLRCGVCGVPFDFAFQLKYHIQKSHPEILIEDKRVENDNLSNLGHPNLESISNESSQAEAHFMDSKVVSIMHSSSSSKTTFNPSSLKLPTAGGGIKLDYTLEDILMLKKKYELEKEKAEKQRSPNKFKKKIRTLRYQEKPVSDDAVAKKVGPAFPLSQKLGITEDILERKRFKEQFGEYAVIGKKGRPRGRPRTRVPNILKRKKVEKNVINIEDLHPEIENMQGEDISGDGTETMTNCETTGAASNTQTETAETVSSNKVLPDLESVLKPSNSESESSSSNFETTSKPAESDEEETVIKIEALSDEEMDASTLPQEENTSDNQESVNQSSMYTDFGLSNFQSLQMAQNNSPNHDMQDSGDDSSLSVVDRTTDIVIKEENTSDIEDTSTDLQSVGTEDSTTSVTTEDVPENSTNECSMVNDRSKRKRKPKQFKDFLPTLELSQKKRKSNDHHDSWIDEPSTSNIQNTSIPSQKSISCTSCGETFSKTKDLQRHVNICAVGIDEFSSNPCLQCPRIFQHASALELHVLKDHADVDKICPFCGKVFAYRSTMKKHMTMHTQGVVQKAIGAVHAQTGHNESTTGDGNEFRSILPKENNSVNDTDSQIRPDNVREKFSNLIKALSTNYQLSANFDHTQPAQESYSGFPSMSDLESGIESPRLKKLLFSNNTPEDDVSVPFASTVETSTTNFKKPHPATVIQENAQTSSDIITPTTEEIRSMNICYAVYSSSNSHKTYRCRTCNEPFPTLPLLYKHEFTLHVKHKCPYCNKGFAYIGALNKHKKIHEGTDIRSCVWCGKKDLKPIAFRNHMLSHNGTNEENHKLNCSICLTSWQDFGGLEVEKEIQDHLESCQEGFEDPDNMLQRYMYAENSQKLQCGDCEMHYIFEKYYKQSISVTHVFTCKVCQKEFEGKELLKDHMVQHHEEAQKIVTSFKVSRMFSCGVCDDSFSCLFTFMSHMHVHKDFNETDQEPAIPKE